jgi:CRISPR/Cas system-associated exonuclease Cas4 (RecB family)
MPDDMIQIPIEQEELDEIFQVLSQIGEVVENGKIKQKETPFIICPNCGEKIPFIE